MMLKSMPLFYSSPPKPVKQTENKKTAKPSTSSESEPDSLSIESSSEEAHPKNHMRTENHKQTPPLEYFPQSALELTGTDKGKQKTGLRKKIVHYLFDKGGKRKEKKPQEENIQPITVDQIKKQIDSQLFYEASQHLIIMQKESNRNLDGRNDEETLSNQSEIEDLLEVLYEKVFIIIHLSIKIASTEPELLNNAVRAVILWVEEEERSIHSQLRPWKEEWRNTIQKSVKERMKKPHFDDNRDLSTTGNIFLNMGKTLKNDMITVVQHIKRHYPENFQVCNTYAKFYHDYFSSEMKMFAKFELSREDNYLLLNWVQNLYQEDIKNNSVLVNELDKGSLGNLLPLEQVKHLEQTYLTHEVDFVRCYLNKCLEIEVESWTREAAPQMLFDYYHSELSIDAIRAIYGAQKRAEVITPELGHQMSALLLTELLTFLQSYKRQQDIFIRANTQNEYFEAIIIANINNFENLRAHVEKSTGSAESDVKTNILSILETLQTTGFNVFLEPLFQELKVLLKKFNEKKWASCSDLMYEIITALDARIRVFKMLKKPHQVIMERIHLCLVQKYIERLMWKHTKLRSVEEQKQLSELIRSHASILYTFCTEKGSEAAWLESAIPRLAEIISLQDPDAIKFQVGALVNTYPDIEKKHLSAILHIKALSSSNRNSILSVLNIRRDATLPSTLLFSGISTALI